MYKKEKEEIWPEPLCGHPPRPATELYVGKPTYGKESKWTKQNKNWLTLRSSNSIGLYKYGKEKLWFHPNFN